MNTSEQFPGEQHPFAAIKVRAESSVLIGHVGRRVPAETNWSQNPEWFWLLHVAIPAQIMQHDQSSNSVKKKS